MSYTTTTYVGYYALEGSSDLPVNVTADSYAHAEFLLGAWRARKGSENATADRLLSADPIRIECDRHALAELESALDRADTVTEATPGHYVPGHNWHADDARRAPRHGRDMQSQYLHDLDNGR